MRGTHDHCDLLRSGLKYSSLWHFISHALLENIGLGKIAVMPLEKGSYQSLPQKQGVSLCHVLPFDRKSVSCLTCLDYSSIRHLSLGELALTLK